MGKQEYTIKTEICWKDTDHEQPEMSPNTSVSRPCLFVCKKAGVCYGYYHDNGCFYGHKGEFRNDDHVAAHTVVALRKYHMNKLPDDKAVLWAYVENPIAKG